jgi:hypothetical protein
MKKLKSLMLSFALAAGVIGVGSATAQAQTPVGQGITVTQNQPAQADLVNNNYVADEVVAAVSQLPMNSIYSRAGRGFTSARVDQTGENVGVEYQLNGSTRTPLRAFNLDDAYGAQQYQNAIATASQTESNIIAQQTRVSYVPVPVFVPSYTYVRPIRPIVLFGPIFSPWHDHYNYRPYDRHHHNTTIIIRGGNDHRGDYRGNDRDRDRDHRGGQRPGHHR